MKKRVLALILAIMMVVTNIVPSLAASSDSLGQNMNAQSVMDRANETDKNDDGNDKNESDKGASPFRQKNDKILKSLDTNPKSPDSNKETATSLQSADKKSSSLEVKESSDPTSREDRKVEVKSVGEASDTSDEVYDDKENDEFPYIGYQEGSAGVATKLYVEKGPKGSDPNPGNRRVVYCFNKTKAWPDSFNNTKKLAYKKTTGSVEAFRDKVNKESKYKGQDLIDKLKTVLANGYPNNDAIQKSLGLSDDDMRTVTQMAIWHFTDNAYNKLQNVYSISDNQKLALAILLDKAGSTTVDKKALPNLLDNYKKDNPTYEVPKGYTPPEQSTLDLYISNGTLSGDHNKEYQNLLSGNLVKPDGSVIDIPRDNKKEEKEIMIHKLGNNAQIAGAEFEISKANDPDKVLKTFKSEKETSNKIQLEVGSYILNEKTAPDGFQKISGIKFEVKADGEIEIQDRGKNEDESVPDDFEVSSLKNNLYITDKEKSENPDQPDEPTPKKTKVIIRKYAMGDYKKLLVGADLELFKISDDDKEITIVGDGSFTSDNKGKEFELTDGSYILKEKNAPAGYKKASDIEFEVKEGKVFINSKIAPKGLKNPFSYDAFDDRTNEDYIVNPNIYGKHYYIKKSPNNQVVYCFNAQKKSPNESYDEGKTIVPDFNNGEVKYNKIIDPDSLYKYAQNPRVSGADLANKVSRVIHGGYPNLNINAVGLTSTQLKAATQLAVYYYTDSAEISNDGLKAFGHGFEVLANDGEKENKIKTYIKALIGYAEHSTESYRYDFYVSNNGYFQNLIGTSYDDSDLHYVIAMEDESEGGTPDPGTPDPEKPKSANIFFSKQDVLGDELAGAKLQIKNKETNEVIKEWVSDGSTQTFKLNEGSYKLVEIAAPKGYKIATEINFAVDKNGKVTADEGSLKTSTGNNVIVMVDDYKETKISFSKTDILGNELPNAELQIIDKSNDKVVQKWTSGDKPQKIELKPGKDEFVETAAPKGYKIATSIEFEITTDGKVVANKDSLRTEGSENIITMVDDYKKSHIFFSKQDILGKELPGAKLQIKNKDTNEVVEEWTSSDAPNTFSLKPGSYEFVETAAPKGYKIATSIDFKITKEGEIEANEASLKTIGTGKTKSKVLVMVDDYKESKIFFSKQDILGKELAGAKLQIKEKATGKVVEEWTSSDAPNTFSLKPG
ncbi:MAG: SpaA isopeptide-forming pilin-related protein, partial [Fenollaria massiliensis]